jgi:hypothetical protein
MLKNITGRLIRKQEEVTGESADFMRDLYEGSPRGFWRFILFRTHEPPPGRPARQCGLRGPH